MVECVQLVVDQVEAQKTFIESHNVDTLETVIINGQRPSHLDETPVKVVDTHEVAAVMDVFRLDNMSNSEMRAEQMSDPFCLDMIRYLEDGLEPGDANRSIVVTLGCQYPTLREGVLYHVVKDPKRHAPDVGPAKQEQLVVPQSSQGKLVAALHSGDYGDT